jgi:hypothetical protein
MPDHHGDLAATHEPASDASSRVAVGRDRQLTSPATGPLDDRAPDRNPVLSASELASLDH